MARVWNALDAIVCPGAAVPLVAVRSYYAATLCSRVERMSGWMDGWMDLMQRSGSVVVVGSFSFKAPHLISLQSPFVRPASSGTPFGS